MSGGRNDLPSEVVSVGRNDLPSDIVSGGRNDLPSDVVSGGRNDLPSDVVSGGRNDLPSDVVSGGRNDLPSDVVSGGRNDLSSGRDDVGRMHQKCPAAVKFYVGRIDQTRVLSRCRSLQVWHCCWRLLPRPRTRTKTTNSYLFLNKLKHTRLNMKYLNYLYSKGNYKF